MKNNELSNKSVVILGFLVYFFSCAMRIDYSATMVAMVADLKITNTMASYAVTGSFIAYGTGMVLCGIIADRISPVKMIKCAMIGTVAVNILVSFCSDMVLITLLWCINGFCQAMIWPSLARFVFESVGKKKYADSITIVGLAGSIGTLFVYLFVSVILEIAVWRAVFRCMSLFGAAVLFIWCYMTRKTSMGRATPEKDTSDENNYSKLKLTIWAGLVPIFAATVLQGVLRDGIQTWLPSMINETFGLKASSSVLSTTMLPILSMISVVLTNVLYHKLKNELKTVSVVFAITFLATIPFGLGLNTPALITVALASIVSGCMHGVNHMLISVVPQNFSKYGKFATISGIGGGFSYLGASVSSFGFAALADNVGWNAVQVSWCVIAGLATLICLLKIKSWTKICE